MDKGYYLLEKIVNQKDAMSQSTIKMDKGYYTTGEKQACQISQSQSTIKMDKGYYNTFPKRLYLRRVVAIHNKNGQRCTIMPTFPYDADVASQSTIKMDKGARK